jgi:two-component sensor histidine kinase/PAS domain-containing protein
MIEADAEPTVRERALAAALADETRRSEVLIRIGEALGAGRDIDAIVQTVIDGGVELTRAEFGAFFYNVVDEAGEGYMLYALSGAPRSAFETYPMPRKTAVFAPTFAGEAIVRSDDILADPRYGQTAPWYGLPPGHLPVRSYLSAPVVSRSGEVLGGLFFGHKDPGRFSAADERVVAGIAGLGAAAVDAMHRRNEILAASEAQRSVEARLAERLSFALDAGRMGSWALDVDSRDYEASDLCKANYGRRPDEPFGFADLVASIDEADRERMTRAMEAAIQDGSDYDIEYRVIWPDGQVRWVHARGRADAIVPGGSAKRMAGISLDITERRRAEARQQLMLNELNHRVKNTLATVQSIAFQTLRTARTPAEFREAFEARLLALSETHNLLTRENWEGASLRAIVDSELDALGGVGRTIVTPGAEVNLSPKAAVAVGMGIHELATNAMKYGALSAPRGLVTVRWDVRDGMLELDWIESDGPRVDTPQRRGFGSRLLEKGLAAELGGSVELMYREQGLTCAMHLPMAALEGRE